jgi:cytochrome c peroxidase
MRQTISYAKLIVVLSFSIPLALTASVHGGGPQNILAPAGLRGKARALRDAIDARVGSVERLRVPASNAALPQPTLDDGVTIDERFAITEAKRYLGKQLFFDPVRSNRIKPQFGGLESTARTGSCGSCHLGEVAGRAGQVVNLHLGGEGRGFTDANGVFHVRRRPQPGLIDVIPTGVQQIVNGVVLKDGRFDAVDAVPRLSPSMIGFAFNNRLLLGGKAGQPAGDPNNPRGLPAGENLAEIAFDSHRMLETQKDAVQESAVYAKLFQDAFPEEAASFSQSGNLDDLINDDTIGRAVAAFLRTVVTRNTPWDKFLAGDDTALTKRQVRGALLFVRDVSEGGANCIACHSGPMLNKQPGDEAGNLVEENFYNVGIGDHPLQGLAAIALEDLNHHDLGRGEITGLKDDNFKFRTLTLRQLRDSGGQLTHSALFGSVRQVVEYFNAGIPNDPFAAAAGNLTPRFTHPRGGNHPPGLGLSSREIDDLVDFIENALYDPAFTRFDPNSTTDTFELNARDLACSINRPDLAALGAVDGLMPSGLCPTSNDALTRRDRGLEFLDVTSRVVISLREVTLDSRNNIQTHHLLLTNITGDPVDTHLILCFMTITPGVAVIDAEGLTRTTPVNGVPYLRVFIPEGSIGPTEVVEAAVRFRAAPSTNVRYTIDLLSGQGNP